MEKLFKQLYADLTPQEVDAVKNSIKILTELRYLQYHVISREEAAARIKKIINGQNTSL